MPCRSDYPPLTELETELIYIYNINDELDEKKTQFNPYHPEVFEQNLSYEDLNLATAKLCKRLQGVSHTHDYSYILRKW